MDRRDFIKSFAATSTLIAVNPTIALADLVADPPTPIRLHKEVDDIPIPIDLYVRYDNGNDSNPGTSSQPFMTIQAAIDSLPSVINRTMKIHVYPSKSHEYDAPNLKPMVLNSNLYMIGEIENGEMPTINMKSVNLSDIGPSDESPKKAWYIQFRFFLEDFMESLDFKITRDK